jgi:hypothetical protein
MFHSKADRSSLFSNTINYEISPVFVSTNLFGIATPRCINSLNWCLFRSAFYMLNPVMARITVVTSYTDR